MYSNKFVACIMVDDEVVREVRKDNSDLVYLPFGTDYQLRLKNLDYRRAVVSISIDGDDVLDGSRLVVEGNSTTDLKGFLDSKSNKARNAFRFIEKTEKVSKHRGDRVDDGLIRIEVQFEEDLPLIEQVIKWPPHCPYEPWDPYNPWYPHRRIFWHIDHFTAGGESSGSNSGFTSQTNQWSGGTHRVNVFNCNAAEPTMDAADVKDAIERDPPLVENADLTGDPVEDASNALDIPPTTNTVNQNGITVTGNIVNQGFTTVPIRKLTAEKVVIVFKLQGKKSDSKLVVKPLLVKSKIECHTCGEKCKSGVKYCPECGTCLL